MAIVVAGPLANFVPAIVALPCCSRRSAGCSRRPRSARCTDSPAAAAGPVPGDRIIEANGDPIESQELQVIVRGHPEQTTFTIERAGAG
jgi:membrane-associated protease RseP (regulator of RpoE activity)